MQAPLVEFRNVTKRFGERTVLDRINLQIFENQITTIVGKSGTGKSVLLKHIIGLLQPNEGEILYNGKPVSKMKRGEWEEYRSHISYLFQGNALFDSLNVFENVALPLRETTDLSKKEIENRVMTRLEQTELADVTDRYPSELSGGMQKRVALARALVTDPRIVLFDEPTTGQDPVRKNAILSMIAHYRRRFGFTAVLISHDVPEAFFIADRIVLLWEGGIAFQGTYEESWNLKHPLVDEFIRSLEGFQDELTGLLSKSAFRSRYGQTLSLARGTVSAIVFSVELELLHENLGPQAAAEILKALGEYTNRHFGPLGGFSARHSRTQIMTMLPHITLEEADQLLDEFSRVLEAEALPGIQSLAQAKVGATSCFEINVQAGVTEVLSDDEIDHIIQKAVTKQRVAATFRCGSGGDEA